ncbi:glycan metabolism protein RagB [Bacteroidia bacterium]|nr:glycan metabolism protein RagB [Bacteroidia bacterium]
MMRNIILLSVVVMLCSCSDFLKESSQDEVIVKTVADYSELLLGSGYPQPAVSIPYPVLYLVDDDVEINEARVTATVNANITGRFGYFTWQPDMWERAGATLGKGYDQTYERIMGCNAVLDYIDEAIGGQEERDKTKAEALAVRAMLYFQLVNMFGEPYNENKAADGVVLKLTSGLEEGGMKRSSVADVYNQILSDLQNSEKLFLKYNATRGNYRINLSSVYILLSRIYLYMEQWDDAVNAATKAIKISKGLTDYTQLSTPFYLTAYDLSEVEWLYGAGSPDLSNGMPVSAFSPSSELISLYSINDMRLTFWFATDKKSVTKKNSASVRPTNTMRISEAYLNRAEAVVRGGSAGNQALSDLNELRRNRIKGYADLTITDNSRLLEEILLERRLELCFEMHRWFDLRRNGMPQIEHLYRDVIGAGNPWVKYTLKERDPLYTLPIPNLMIEHNLLLSQNASAYGPERAGTDIN